MQEAADLRALVARYPTPVVADAVVRLGLPLRTAPAGISGPPGAAVAGPVLPVRHSGSVDVFLEAANSARRGDVMVIDNSGRTDEACIGDLVVHELMAAGVAGIIIWGLHRDAVEIAQIGLAVFSYGTLPCGPLQPRPAPAEPFSSAAFGEHTVTSADVAVADPNGVVFLASSDLEEVAAVAESIMKAEREQISLLTSGTSLREQFDLEGFLRARERDRTRTFRQHLRERGRAVEE